MTTIIDSNDPRMRVDTVTGFKILELPPSSMKTRIEFLITCPKCGKKAYVIYGICRGCKESEHGKYKTMFKCNECRYEEKSIEHVSVWLNRLGIDYSNQSKESLGIKTMTDNGLK